MKARGRGPGNILAQTPVGRDAMAHSVYVRRHARVRRQHGQHNSLCVQQVPATTDEPAPFFDTNDAGIKVYTYVPGNMALTVRGAFSTPGGL